jgi:hypothetical protein
MDDNTNDNPSNILMLPVVTKLAIPCERILSEAAKLDFTRIIIIGLDTDGDEYFASSDPDGGTLLWDLERVKYKLIDRRNRD